MFLVTTGLSLFLLSPSSGPQSEGVGNISLRQVVSAAILEPDLVGRLGLAEDQSKANMEQAKARRGPTFSLDGHINGGLNAGLADNTPSFDRDRVGFIMDLNLYDGGKGIGAVHQAQKTLDLTKLTSQQSIYDAKSRAIQFFTTALRAQEHSVATASLLKSAAQNLSDVKIKFESGTAVSGDVTAAASALAQIQLQAIAEERDKRNALSELEVLIGSPPEKGADVNDLEKPRMPLPTTASATDLYAKAVYADNTLKQLQVQLQLSDLNLQIAKSEFLPSVHASLGIGYVDYQNIQQSGGSSVVTREYLYVGLAGSVPIFTNKIRKETIRSGVDAKKQIALQLDERRERIRLAAVTATSDLVFTKAEKQAAEAQINDARERSRQAQMRFQNGLGTEADVLTAFGALASAEYALTNSQIDEMEARMHILLLENPDWLPQ